MATYKRAVGLFYSRDEAETALRALKNDGFDMKRVNLIARDANQVTENTDLNYNEDNNASEGVSTGASTGAVFGGLGGLLVGLGTLAIPGVGPILVAGEAATVLATTLAGAGIGAATGGIIGGLVGLGIPDEKARIYSDRVAGGSYLLMINGSENEVYHAERVLARSGIEEFGIYDAHDLTKINRTATVNTQRSTATEPIMREPAREMSVPDQDPDVVIVRKFEELL